MKRIFFIVAVFLISEWGFGQAMDCRLAIQQSPLKETRDRSHLAFDRIITGKSPDFSQQTLDFGRKLNEKIETQKGFSSLSKDQIYYDYMKVILGQLKFIESEERRTSGRVLSDRDKKVDEVLANAVLEIEKIKDHSFQDRPSAQGTTKDQGVPVLNYQLFMRSLLRLVAALSEVKYEIQDSSVKLYSEDRIVYRIDQDIFNSSEQSVEGKLLENKRSPSYFTAEKLEEVIYGKLTPEGHFKSGDLINVPIVALGSSIGLDFFNKAEAMGLNLFQMTTQRMAVHGESLQSPFYVAAHDLIHGRQVSGSRNAQTIKSNGEFFQWIKKQRPRQQVFLQTLYFILTREVGSPGQVISVLDRLQNLSQKIVMKLNSELLLLSPISVNTLDGLAYAKITEVSEHDKIRIVEAIVTSEFGNAYQMLVADFSRSAYFKNIIAPNQAKDLDAVKRYLLSELFDFAMSKQWQWFREQVRNPDFNLSEALSMPSSDSQTPGHHQLPLETPSAGVSPNLELLLGVHNLSQLRLSEMQIQKQWAQIFNVIAQNEGQWQAFPIQQILTNSYLWRGHLAMGLSVDSEGYATLFYGTILEDADSVDSNGFNARQEYGQGYGKGHSPSKLRVQYGSQKFEVDTSDCLLLFVK